MEVVDRGNKRIVPSDKIQQFEATIQRKDCASVEIHVFVHIERFELFCRGERRRRRDGGGGGGGGERERL